MTLDEQLKIYDVETIKLWLTDVELSKLIPLMTYHLSKESNEKILSCISKKAQIIINDEIKSNMLQVVSFEKKLQAILASKS